ncbi:helix-turn-helix transcriptional regulator [Streptomyces cyaneogriseus]|uniref:helix-turn-helix transcriptional regulator n=1 Tax=Streptomyces cyaneogriseus TaxID=68192 RepID=UPI001331776E|nr:LuxR C-terminal-related transcriptional regulator [Streptomyces cyaneogriseus]
MLEPFGIGPATEELYYMMLKHPEMDVQQLAKRLDWQEKRVQKEIERLAGLSLLRPSLDDPDALRPVEPDIGLEVLIAREQAVLAERERRLKECKAAARTLAAEYAERAGPVLLDTEQIRGADRIRHRLTRLLREARDQVMVFTPGELAIPETGIAGKATHDAISRRGIRIRSIQLDSIRNDKGRRARLQRLLDHGVEIRTVPVLSPWGVIVDLEKAVLSQERRSRHEDGAIVLTGASVVAPIAAVFEQVWLSATPLTLQDQRRKSELTDTERALLQLLQEGYTDAQVARRLAVSPRTVGRVVADLMAKLGASSRFQAGVLARRRGWLSP